MPKGTNQKLKLYRLAQIMLENTDDEHYITMPEIMEELGKYEVTADRKTIYADLRDLSVLGIEVEGEPIGNRYHYRVVNRPFELPELKLLVDSIQSSKFITEKKTNTLIKKLEKLVSKYDAVHICHTGHFITTFEHDSPVINIFLGIWDDDRQSCCTGR